jgi:CHAT domain-containing protein
MTERHRPYSVMESLWEMFVRHPGEILPVLRTLPLQARFIPVAAGLWLWFGSAATASLYEGWGLGATAARWFAAALLATSAVALVLVVAAVLSARYSRISSFVSTIVLATVPALVGGTAVFNVGFGLPLGVAMALAAAGAAGGIRYVKVALARGPRPVRTPLWLDDATRAEELVAACEHELLEATLTDEERAAVEANLSSGLIVLALANDRDDALVRACEILARSLGAMDPGDAYLGAARLVEAMAAKALRTGDIEGYEEALQLLLDAAGSFAAGITGVMARAHLIRATHLAALSRRAEEDGLPGRSARLRDEAIDGLLQALERSSPRRTVYALAELEFASLVERDGDDLDAAIALSREALGRLRLRPRVHRDGGRLVLSDLLADRALRGGTRRERDLAEATSLCRRLQRRPASRTQASRRLPRLLALGAAPADDVGRAYRQAFGELSQLSGGYAGDLAAEWSAWAIGHATAPEAAEAHWCWIRAVADDARRRPLRAEKERRLSHVLGLAARAAERLLAAGRVRDAAVALDLGRAMLLTERMHRDRDGIDARLVAAGRSDLADRWRQASERISQADRDGFVADRAAPNTMLVGGRRFQARFTTTDHLALADREHLLREIARVPGCEDVDAPADYEDLQAAAVEGPIVYLSVGTGGAHAVIVTEAEPIVIPSALTAADLEPHVRRLRAATDAGDAGEVTDALSETLPWLWSTLMQPVAAALAPGALVTLIPLGQLSLLPLHVACLGPDEEGRWRDRGPAVAFRYAPNARVLGRAQAHARTLDAAALRVLTVDVGHAPGEPPLPRARDESAGVLARFAHGRTERPSPASCSAVLAAMERCGVWHFACHGIHDPIDPLESSLALCDGRLKLRTIFARPASSRRLAVLSACRTATAGEALLDEVVSFPSALLQAGVAGVVSSQFEVPDEAAMLLVLRFFDELADRGEPPRALARAQAWLCSATNAEIHAQLADVYPAPLGRTDAQLAYWRRQRAFAEPHCWAAFSYCGA